MVRAERIFCGVIDGPGGSQKKENAAKPPYKETSVPHIADPRAFKKTSSRIMAIISDEFVHSRA